MTAKTTRFEHYNESMQFMNDMQVSFLSHVLCFVCINDASTGVCRVMRVIRVPVLSFRTRLCRTFICFSCLSNFGVRVDGLWRDAGTPGKHYQVCLKADANGRKDAAVAALLHSQVRPTAVQGLMACGVKNAQSTSAAREHLNKVYRTSGHRAATNGILKGISVCTGCADALERPLGALAATEPGGPELHGVPLAAVKGENALGERRCPPPSLTSLATNDLVDMTTDELKQRYKRTVTMAEMVAYTLTEDREQEFVPTGAWTMIKERELVSLRVCCVIYVLFFCLPTRLCRCFRLFCAIGAFSSFPKSCLRTSL